MKKAKKNAAVTETGSGSKKAGNGARDDKPNRQVPVGEAKAPSAGKTASFTAPGGFNQSASSNGAFLAVETLRGCMLDKLWELQLSKGYISDDDIATLAINHDVSQVEVEGVVSFYHFLHRQPAGKYTIYVNNSMTSEIKGYRRVLEAFERETGAAAGSVDPTGTFGLYLTPCIGLSDQEPAALINFHPFTNLNTLKIRSIITKLKRGIPVESTCDHPEPHIRYTTNRKEGIFFRDFTPGQVLSELSGLGQEGVTGLIRDSKLAGRGGAFYPTWMKWQAAAEEENTPRIVICNADEGEPGTFKDRVLMQEVPETMIEGMIACAFTIGAEYGFIYLRGEYRWLKPRIDEALQMYREKGYLGKNCGGITGFNFDIRIQMGAGSYVCGEETALIESLEGNRGEPRTKWYFPVQRGYLQLPTVVNNVETFCTAARIIQIGIEAYLKYGLPKSPGTKLISVSGDCAKPGIYEIEWGMTLKELMDLCEADDPFYIQESGPSGTVLSVEDMHRPIAMFGDMFTQHIRCGGAITTFSKRRDIVQILMNYADFYKRESCGICTPCRAGNFIIERKLEHLQNGLADAQDIEDLKNWSMLIRNTSRCGLGKTATNSMVIALEKFQDYFSRQVAPSEKAMNRKFDLEAATREYELYKD
jgi:[NiFe] hydrogenase diaphorase moiety large subunit